MEAAIYNGFKSLLDELSRLICVRYLSERDGAAIKKLLQKSTKSDRQKNHAITEIFKDLYGSRMGEVFEYGITEAFDTDDVKLESLKTRWDGHCPGFYDWFLANRKKEFLDSVIVSARHGTNINGLYNRNDI